MVVYDIVPETRPSVVWGPRVPLRRGEVKKIFTWSWGRDTTHDSYVVVCFIRQGDRSARVISRSEKRSHRGSQLTSVIENITHQRRSHFTQSSVVPESCHGPCIIHDLLRPIII